MANRLLENLYQIQEQYNSFRYEEIEAILDFISSENITMSSTKYLIDNFEKVKLRTVAHFWIELTIEIKNKFNCRIEFEPNIEDIENIEELEYYLTHTKVFELHFILDVYFRQGNGIHIGIMKGEETEHYYQLKPMRMFIGDDFGEWLFFGQKSNPADDNKDIPENQQLLRYVNSKREWRSDIFTDRINKIKFSDFSHQATFDLIDKNKRREKITDICNEIEFYLYRYKGIFPKKFS